MQAPMLMSKTCFPLFCILLLLCVVLKEATCEDAKPILFQLSQFMESTALEQCREDLVETDEDGDMKIDRDEYFTFLNLQTDSALGVDRQGIPFRLEAVYLSAACWCEVVDPNDNQCCLHGNDHIPLNESMSPLVAPYLDFLCVNVQQGLAEAGLEVGPEISTQTPFMDPLDASSWPSDSRSDVPSQLPSDFPSVIPTLRLSDMPTIGPSIYPTMGPSDFPSLGSTESPSALPTTAPSNFPTLDSTERPTEFPSLVPSAFPTMGTSESPTEAPSWAATGSFTNSPTDRPSIVSEEIPFTPSHTISPLPTLCVDFQCESTNRFCTFVA